MVDVEKNYKYYADQEREGFISLYKLNNVYDFMAGMAQGICEKYLKHIIDLYCQPSSLDEKKEKELILHTHNLKSILSLLSEYGFEISKSDKQTILSVNGYYYSTRYPGSDISYISKEDLTECLDAINTCKNIVDSIEQQLNPKDDIDLL